MFVEYLLATAVLCIALAVLGGPSLIAAYRWRYRGGKLLNDRLGPPARKRRT